MEGVEKNPNDSSITDTITRIRVLQTGPASMRGDSTPNQLERLIDQLKRKEITIKDALDRADHIIANMTDSSM